MPAALEVDKDAVKLVAFQIGVREAARQFGLDEERVLKWSQREKWGEQFALVKQRTAVAMDEKRGSSNVRSPLEVLASLGDRSKLRAAKVGDNTLKAIGKRKEDRLIASAPAYLATVNALAKVHGWGEAPASTVNLAVQINAAQVPSA